MRVFGREDLTRTPACDSFARYHSGMLPCFFVGNDARFVRSARNAFTTATRVAAGSDHTVELAALGREERRGHVVGVLVGQLRAHGRHIFLKPPRLA